MNKINYFLVFLLLFLLSCNSSKPDLFSTEIGAGSNSCINSCPFIIGDGMSMMMGKSLCASTCNKRTEKEESLDYSVIDDMTVESKFENHTHTIRLKWGRRGLENKYTLYKNENLFRSMTTSTDIIDYGLTPSTRYCYKVKSYLTTDYLPKFVRESESICTTTSSEQNTVIEQVVEIGNFRSLAVDDNNTMYVSQSKKVMAIKPDKSLIWEYILSEADDFINMQKILLHNDVLYGLNNRKVFALNVGSGELLWELELTTIYQRALDDFFIANNGTIHVHSHDNLYAINSSGTLLWEYGFEEIDGHFPVQNGITPDGTVYVSVADKVHAIDTSGSLLWKYVVEPTDNNELPVQITGLSVGSEGIYFSDSDHSTLYAINASGSLLWQYNYGDGTNIRTNVKVGDNGIIYFNSNIITDGILTSSLKAINSSGSLLWSKTFHERNDVPSDEIDKLYGMRSYINGIGHFNTIFIGYYDTITKQSRSFVFDEDGNQIWDAYMDMSRFLKAKNNRIYLSNIYILDVEKLFLLNGYSLD